MIKCPKCKEIIGPSAPAYKASRGFIDSDGIFHEDEAVIAHMDCSYDYTLDLFNVLEERLKEK